MKLLGKRATGTGARGHAPEGPNRTARRRAFNTVTCAYERWFCYPFSSPGSALPREESLGNGDSGGSVLIEVEGHWRLARIDAWKLLEGDVRTARHGRTEQVS